jgi:nicotinamidase/pyrazinamidase
MGSMATIGRNKVIINLTFIRFNGWVCLDYTVIDALNEGFSSTFIEDASRPLKTETFVSIKEDLINMGTMIINIEEIFAP